jgi:GTP cyclohydrolase II
MFSYIDPGTSDLLRQRGLLRQVDGEGRTLEEGCPEAPYLSILGPVPLPVLVEQTEVTFRWYPFVRRAELGLIERVGQEVRRDRTRDLVPLLSTYMQVSSALVLGSFEQADAPIVRLHSCCMTSDVFGSRRCECGPQLHAAFARVVAEGTGAVIYLSSHEGRGIGLWAKAVTYLLQDMGQDTYQANQSLGLPEDSRDFLDAAVVLRALRPDRREVRLLTNNPLKVSDLQRGGITITEVAPLVVGLGRHNQGYMKAKRSKGHLIPDEAFSPDPPKQPGSH